MWGLNTDVHNFSVNSFLLSRNPTLLSSALLYNQLLSRTSTLTPGFEIHLNTDYQIMRICITRKLSMIKMELQEVISILSKHWCSLLLTNECEMDLFYFTWGVCCNICLWGANTVQAAITVLCALHHLLFWNVCTVQCTRIQNNSMGTVEENRIKVQKHIRV